MKTAKREMTVNHEERCVEAAVKATLQYLGARMSDAAVPGRITARTGSSTRSWGENVTVVLRPAETGTHVSVAVESALSTTLVDYGASRRVADQLARAAADPDWAASLVEEIGLPVHARGWAWLGLAASAGAAALTWVPSVSPRRVPLLIAAGVAAVLWLAAVASRSLVIRRRGQHVPPWQSAVMLFGLLVVGLPVADALKLRHASLALSTSANLSSAAGALALTALLVATVRRFRRRHTTGADAP